MNGQNLNMYYWGGLWTVLATALVSHTKFSVPPALFIFAITFLLSILLISKGGYRKIPIYALITIPFALYLIITQPFTTANVRNYIGPILSVLFFPVTIYFVNKLNREKVYRIVRIFITFSTLVLIFETIYRYIFPDQDVAAIAIGRGGQGLFYMYKSSSLMYTDSNGAAIHILIVLFFTFYWAEYTNQKYKLIKFILIILIGLSLSRAAWLGTLCGLIYFKFLRGKSLVFWISWGIIVITLVAFMFFVVILPKIGNDGSFLSKFVIVEHVVNFYSHIRPVKDYLIGIGVYQSINIFGIYAHSFFVVQLLEMGIVSFILLIIMWGMFGVYTKWKVGIILIPFVITTLSSTLSFMPSFYVAMALMCYVENSLRNENCIYNTIVS